MARWVDPPHIIWNSKAASSGVFNFDYDWTAYEQANIWITVTGIAGDPTSATLDFVVNRKDVTTLPVLNDSLAVWTAIANSSITQIATDSGSSGLTATRLVQLTSSHLAGRIQLRLTVDASGGTAPSLTTTMTALLKG